MMDGKLIQEKKAFLFDFDGVVADSEPYAFNILKRLMKDHFDVVIDDEDVSITIGNSTAGTARNMERKYGVSLSYDDFVRFLMDYPDYYTEYEGIKPFTDLPELFDMLKKSGRKNVEQFTVAVIDTIFSPKKLTAADVEQFRFIPGTDDKAQFILEAGFTTASGVTVPIVECRAPYKLFLDTVAFRQDIVNLIDDEVNNFNRYPGVKFGSMDAANNEAGNWE